MNRCINIDWLEIYALEPQDANGNAMNTPDYFQSRGFIVKQREYGTPIYLQMFTIYSEFSPSIPFLEIRRQPRPNSTGGTFLPPNSCHLRLPNQMCYIDYPLQTLGEFMFTHNYEYKQIKRIDICLDFNKFDSGDHPAHFIKNFLANKYAKINQCNIALHGVDGWDGRQFNSIKWGSPASNITTKLYNKTLEMKTKEPKTYIQEAWTDAGLDTNSDIWRLEFSIKAGRKGFKNIKTQEYYHMKFGTFADRNRLLFVFHSLCAQYFHFKYIQNNTNGTRQRKDRCKDKQLFYTSAEERAYKPINISLSKDLTRTDKILMRKLYQLSEDTTKTEELRTCAKEVADYIYNTIKHYIGY